MACEGEFVGGRKERIIMVDCKLPVLSVATCEYQEFFDNRTQCNGRGMFEGHCPFRKVEEDAPAEEVESQATDA
jgi:hypothetical protein